MRFRNLALLVGLWLSAPAVASAQSSGACASVFDCYCYAAPLAVISGPVTAANTIEVETLEPPDAMVDFVVGDEVVGYGSVEVGDTGWAVVDGNGVGRIIAIEQGSVSCFGEDPVDAQVATAAALSMTCRADLQAAGLEEPPCGDGGEVISDSSSDSGCAVTAAGGSTPHGLVWLAAGALAFAALRRRRR